MSLERTALRLGMAMALSNGYAAPFPTIAQDRVYDSRIDAVQGLQVNDLAPIIIIFTDDDDRDQLSTNNGGPPWKQCVNLILELSIGMVGPLFKEGTDEPLLDEAGNVLPGELLPVATEPELEAMLDLFEAQIERLFRQLVNAWSGARLYGEMDSLMVRIESWNSKRYVEREAQNRLAARQIIIRCQLPQPPEALIVSPPGEGEPAPTPFIPAPLGPLLQDIIDDAGPYAPSAQAIQDLLLDNGGFGPLVLAPLKRIRLKESDAGGGKRPDGVAQANLPEA
jgi:hypothetical protein